MNASDAKAYLLIFTALGIFAALWFLFIILYRERVKTDLREKNLTPLSVRWRFFPWWAGYYSCAFVVRYLDLNGLTHKASCWIAGGRGVNWVKDEIVG